MPWLTSCCCGFSVRTGTKAIAILSLVYSVLGLLMVGTFKIERDRLVTQKTRHFGSSYSDYSLHNIHRELQEGLPTLRPSTRIFASTEDYSEGHGDSQLQGDKDGSREEQDRKKAARLELIMTVYAVSVSVNFLVSLSLLAGVRLGQRWLLVPWISWNVLSLLVSQMAVFYAPNKAMTTIPDLFSTVISVYCILCVVSYFQELTANPPSISRHDRPPSWPDCGMSSTRSLEPENQDSPQARLSPRRPALIVTLPPPPDMGPPPAYPSLGSLEAPPGYDPPPPYPGSPTTAKLKEELAMTLIQADTGPVAGTPAPQGPAAPPAPQGPGGTPTPPGQVGAPGAPGGAPAPTTDLGKGTE